MKLYTYDDQPNNVEAWKIGESCRSAADDQKCGDPIDRGLILLRELQARGFGIVALTVKSSPSD